MNARIAISSVFFEQLYFHFLIVWPHSLSSGVIDCVLWCLKFINNVFCVWCCWPTRIQDRTTVRMHVQVREQTSVGFRRYGAPWLDSISYTSWFLVALLVRGSRKCNVATKVAALIVGASTTSAAS